MTDRLDYNPATGLDHDFDDPTFGTTPPPPEGEVSTATVAIEATHASDIDAAAVVDAIVDQTETGRVALVDWWVTGHDAEPHIWLVHVEYRAVASTAVDAMVDSLVALHTDLAAEYRVDRATAVGKIADRGRTTDVDYVDVEDFLHDTATERDTFGDAT